jgi:hypothetical protein
MTKPEKPDYGIDVSKILAPSNIKTLLYRREPKMATLPLSSQRLIGTTCALFLRNLLEGSSINAYPDAHATLKGLSQVVAVDPLLPETLANAVLHCGEKRALEDIGEFTPVRACNPKRLRCEAQGATRATEPNRQGEESEELSIKAAISASVDTGASAIARGQLIVEDGDDYD